MIEAADKETPVRRPKGALARARLKESAITVLGRMGYHQMRIKDVTEEAGVAAGLFYHYFKDLKSLVEELLEEHIAAFEATADIERNVDKGDWFRRLVSHYEIVVRAYAENPGLMRCVGQFCADDADFNRRWRQSYHQRIHQLIDVFPYVFPDSELDPAEAELVVYALGGLGQDLLHEYYIERSPHLEKLKLDQEEMAEWLAALFYRGLFARNPSRRQLHHAEKILSIKR